MGRQENVEIFEDTFALCEQNSTLRNAIEQSTKKQKLYACGTGNCGSDGVPYADDCIRIDPDVHLFRCHQQGTEYQHKQDRRDR